MKGCTQGRLTGCTAGCELPLQPLYIFLFTAAAGYPVAAKTERGFPPRLSSLLSDSAHLARIALWLTLCSSTSAIFTLSLAGQCRGSALQGWHGVPWLL